MEKSFFSSMSCLGACSLQTCMSSSDSLFLHRSRGIGPNQCFKPWEKNAETVMNSDNCKHRNDISGQSTLNGTLFGDTAVQRLHKPQEFMSKTGHIPESSIIFANMSDDITIWESRKVQDKCPAQAREVATYAANFSFCCSGSV